MNKSKDYSVQKAIAIFILFAASLALIGIFPIDSFGFYMFLRVIVFLSFILSFVSMLKYIEDRGEILLIAPLGMLLFNPFDIIVHEKSTWIIFDLITAFLMAFWGIYILKDIENEKKDDEYRLRIGEEIDTMVNELVQKLNIIKNSKYSHNEKSDKSFDLIINSHLPQNRKHDLLLQSTEIYRNK